MYEIVVSRPTYCTALILEAVRSVSRTDRELGTTMSAGILEQDMGPYSFTAMDREILKEHLVLAERHIASGQEHIAKQRRIAAELGAGGHTEAAAKARALLTEFEEILDRHISDRDRLLKELGR